MIRWMCKVSVMGAAALLLLAAAGCGGGKSEEASTPRTPVTAADRAEADQLFATRCAACHGTTGMGDGPGALALTPKPRNYRDLEWQKKVKDEEIERAIVYGGTSVGKSPQMIANPDLQAKPGVVAALREIIREFGQQ